MEQRNFRILIAASVITITIVWLSIYNFIALDINPIDYARDQVLGKDEGETIVTITGSGVKQDLELSLNEIKSSDYFQVKDKSFEIENSYGTQFNIEYSGASLWSILETEDILTKDASSLTFRFIGEDGFQSERALSLEIAKKNCTKVILAYEEDGEPLFQDGPIRSVIDQSVIPNEISSRYWVKSLAKVRIEEK